VLRTRLWTAAVALPATIAILLFASNSVFTVFIALMTAWSLYEIIAMVKAKVVETLMVAICGGGPAIYLLMNGGGSESTAVIVVIAAILPILALVALVALEGAERVPRTWLVAIGALWVGMLFPYFALLRNAPGGIPIIMLTFLLVIASDSGAYFVGRSLGRTKLLLRVSPNKTVEGAIGGLAACVVAGIILRPLLAPRWTTGAVVIMAAVVGVLAQFGDAAGSAFKRVAGVKDSGWILPGHGGLIDRACSLFFAAAFTYYYLLG
jgi:phosphatidate cytidylyltransferase